MFSRHRSAQPVDSKYHELRQEARKAMDISEFSDEDILNGRLDEGFTEGLDVPTGEDARYTYVTEPRIVSEGTETSVDIRTLDRR